MIDEKYISVQKHPTEDLYIYNYTQKAQFDRMWNEATMACRGLIMNGKGEIIARPFKKFFNYGEYTGEIPSGEFEITEKMDGSLGILYWIGTTPYIATRGSFMSEQAIKGSKMIQQIYADNSTLMFDPAYTYLFEIIYPENRIVVDYKGWSGLVLLSMVHTKTGVEVRHRDISWYERYFDVVKRYEGKDINTLKDLAQPNKEGFVVQYENGFRLKVKFDEYVRLHRLVTGLNARHIWENLMEGNGIEEMIDHVPDEFYEWVKNTASRIEARYKEIKAISSLISIQSRKYPTRKEKAEFIMQVAKFPSIVFLMLDGREYSKSIWKIIKPAHEVPFKKEI